MKLKPRPTAAPYTMPSTTSSNSFRMTRKSSRTAVPLPSSSSNPAEKALDASSPGPGTNVLAATASQRLSPHTTRLVATIAPQAAATSTNRHGSFSLRSSLRTTKSPNAVVGTQASVQATATPGPAEPANRNTSLKRSHRRAARPRRTPARTRWRALVLGSRSKARTPT